MLSSFDALRNRTVKYTVRTNDDVLTRTSGHITPQLAMPKDTAPRATDRYQISTIDRALTPATSRGTSNEKCSPRASTLRE